MPISVTLADTCFGCYLTDHHNRPGELLLGVPVDGRTRYHQVKKALKEEIQVADFGLPATFNYGEFRRAVDECFADADGRRLFDGGLDRTYNDEMPSAWFLVKYSTESEG